MSLSSIALVFRAARASWRPIGLPEPLHVSLRVLQNSFFPTHRFLQTCIDFGDGDDADDDDDDDDDAEADLLLHLECFELLAVLPMTASAIPRALRACIGCSLATARRLDDEIVLGNKKFGENRLSQKWTISFTGCVRRALDRRSGRAD